MEDKSVFDMNYSAEFLINKKYQHKILGYGYIMFLVEIYKILEARKQKKYKKADFIRNELKKCGFTDKEFSAEQRLLLNRYKELQNEEKS
jgi:cysteinyl-tRNA synthetase